MSNIFNMVSEETFIEKLDTQNALLAAIMENAGGSIKPTSWAQVQTLVRAGLASRVFAIGDQLTMHRGNATLVWDIIGIDHDTPTDPQFTHSMTLQLHDCFDGTQFDNKEAFFFCESALPAGTYKFTVGAHSWVSGDVGKTFQFTLTTQVPAGGQLVFNNAYNVTFANATLSSYASRTSTTALETVTMTEGSGGSSLGTFNNEINGNVNSCQRALLGSNNYKESAMRQFLNSAAAAGSVWTPQTKFDRPPSWVTSLAGWKNGMDADFLAVLGETHIVVSRNTVCDGGGSDEMDDTFFLLSRREIYAGNEVGNVIEGEPYPYYSDYSDLPAAGTGNDTNRIKYRNGSAQYWWLRSPYAGHGSLVRYVGTAGNINLNYANNSHGVAPACNII